MASAPHSGSNAPLILVLGGGNALGSYHAGAYAVLHRQERQPDWIVGASIGAITGALIAGNPPETRLERLEAFWSEAMIHSGTAPDKDSSFRRTYNTLHMALTLMIGRPGLFRHRFPGLWSILPWMPRDVAVYDHAPLRETLQHLIDFDRLNGGEIRFTFVCSDLKTGEEVIFDTLRDRIGPDHLLATSAIAPIFPPVTIGKHLLCDPGYVNNLPVDLALADPPEEDATCIAVDLFSLGGGRQAVDPDSLEAIVDRTKQLIFASQGRRTIAALKREYALRDKLEPGGSRLTLLHLAYQAQSDDQVGSTFDYSPASIRDRWSAGERDMDRALKLLEAKMTGKKRLRILTLEPSPAMPSSREAMQAAGGS